MATYLAFEQPLKEIEESIESAKLRGDESAISGLHEQLEKEVSRVYSSLGDFEKLQLARHPDRPYSLDYIKLIMDDAYEIHGDRAFKDDSPIVCYLGYIQKQKCVVIGEQKGRGIQNKVKRNFGMPNPEGYRKALRAVRLAEKFNLPVLMLIDTPGAYPGIGAEERGQSEAIARNLFEFSDVKVPLVSVVIGEGGSGGALAIGVADRFAMMRYSVFSVISPEGCASILWSDQGKVKQATEAMKITADSLKSHELIDDILDEPLIGAHRDKEAAARVVKDYFLETVKQCHAMSMEKMLIERYDKLTKVGAFTQEG
ncbi:MAG: acetyl-CoA carboxylase carboxyl transferase subunit alpha [Campylobacterota bacterium]